MNRDNALELLNQYVDSDRIRKHSFAVEATMRGYADYYKEDIDLWGNMGLLHDIDYDKYPQEHCIKAREILKDAGIEEDIILDICAHNPMTGLSRQSLRAKVLFAVDELSSFVIATALVRPDKLEGLTAKSVKKKLKDKAFARAVNRELIDESCEELELDKTEHITRVIEYIQKHEEKLNESGQSML